MIRRETIFSPCQRYRYTLWRQWSIPGGERNGGYVAFIGLNPSTADKTNDDPTVRRCCGFAQAWGFEAMVMLNLFAYISTDPRVILTCADPVGPDNDKWLKRLGRTAAKTVAAWGIRGGHLNRAQLVRTMFSELYCLGTTKRGYPRHPLYVRNDQQLKIWRLEPHGSQ